MWNALGLRTLYNNDMDRKINRPMKNQTLSVLLVWKMNQGSGGAEFLSQL